MATKKRAPPRQGNTGKGSPPPRRTRLPQSNPREKPFTPEVLDRTAIAVPLLEMLAAERRASKRSVRAKPKLYSVIIDVHLEFPGGRRKAKDRVIELVKQILSKGRARKDTQAQGVDLNKSELSEQYAFGKLEGWVIEELVRRDLASEKGRTSREGPKRSIYRIWPDFEVKALLNKSISTVKADAAINSFATTGDHIVWAVMDSGVDSMHPHFGKHTNLDLSGLPPLTHRDFTAIGGNDAGALTDKFGHGTHVAGIIAGEMSEHDGDIQAVTRFRDETGAVQEQTMHLTAISGMAPKCKLLSLKVLDDDGHGQASSLIAAIEEIQRINGYGRYIRVQGVNMSVGYDFEPEWFACGQSPLCVEVDRLVKSGVVVVVAAGNTGYGYTQTMARGVVSAGLGLTINDPGNSELAITVGSTHREMPHVYGVSYFSSKGPTGDGRSKPDLVAPGEKIVSCASGSTAANSNGIAMKNKVGRYREDSGTSMAAPHVSGVIAAFLSVRREFIGRPEKVKQIFISTATDLNRDRYFQGSGLVDLMRAIQSV